MNIRGIQRFSLVDFPHQIACIVFVGNCNFRCPYCHNPCLVFDPESQPLISEDEFFSFLESRHGKLEGVVISGGEPSLRPGLGAFAKQIKNMGFKVKLDTNGSNPQAVFDIYAAGDLDALGVDFKAPKHLYSELTKCTVSGLWEKAVSIIEFALEHKIPLDIRTTVHKKLLDEDALKKMREELNCLGAESWVLQQFNPVEIIDKELLDAPTYSDIELRTLAEGLGNNTRVRGIKVF